MEDFVNGVSKMMEQFHLMKENYSNDIEDILKKLGTIVSKSEEKTNEKTPKPEKKKLKRTHVRKPFEKIEDGNTSTIQNTSKQSHRLPRAGKTKLSQAKKASTSIRLKEPRIEIEVLSDNDLNDPKKSTNSKIKKEKFKTSPQTRRVTRASTRNQNLSINLYNASNERISIDESVEVIPEESSVIILSDQDEDTKEKSLQQKLVIPVQSDKLITRSLTKSLKKSSSPEKSNTSVNTSSENVSSMDSNNNKDENNKNIGTINNDSLSETPKEPESVVRSETFTCPVDIPTNTTFVQPVVPMVTGDSAFVVNRKLSNENENSENKTPLVETEKIFILPQSEAQKVDILNPNIPIVSKGEEPVPENRVPVANSNDLKQVNTAVLKPKNTGAIPKQSSKNIKDAGVNRKTPVCTVLLKKPNLSSKLHKSPLIRKPVSGKAPPREYNNNLQQERKKAVSQIKLKNQSPNLMQIQQEKEFLRRLEKKRLEIEAKDKQKLERQIAMEQKIKKTFQAIQEKKLQIAQNKQNGDLQKKAYNFDTLNSEDSTDDENYKSTKKCEPPMWSKHLIRELRIECQNFMPVKIIDSLFSVAPLNPDLREIFPEINPAELKRNSSIFWRTPPRYSQLPKY